MSKLKEILTDKDRRRGVVGTFFVHLVILVALLFLALRTPLPLPGEEGVEVNLGYDETGSGNVQSQTPPPQSEPTPPPQPKPRTVEPDPIPQQEENLVQDIEEAPMIEEKKKEEPPEEIIEEPKEEIKEEPVKEEVVEEEPEEEPVDSTFVAEEPAEEIPVEEPKPVVNKKALYPGSTKSGQGTSQGVTEGSGDQGKPQGAEDSEKYDGQGGKGNGISFSLGGRGSRYLETPSANFKEQGTVVVSIWVNRQGEVTRAQVNPKGTTVLDPNLRKLAVDAAKNSTFVEDPVAAELQRGTITYNFILMK
ncbi:MAG: energy transducer TonB [Bacteroidales bacterium]|nr:energy transducer TonB [Bacteroidales bacterium]